MGLRLCCLKRSDPRSGLYRDNFWIGIIPIWRQQVHGSKYFDDLCLPTTLGSGWEYQVFGYYVTEEDHYPILENGEVVDTSSADQLPVRLTYRLVFLIVNWSDNLWNNWGKYHLLCDRNWVSGLDTEQGDEDLVTVTMKDGTRFRKVPVSQDQRKWPLLQPNCKLIEDDSVIDMEAGYMQLQCRETMATLAQEKKKERRRKGKGTKQKKLMLTRQILMRVQIVTEQHEEVPAE